MALKLQAADGVKVYCVSGGKKLPDWVNEKKRQKTVKKDEELRRRIDLIQDLSFPASCQRVKASRDGDYLAAAGVHPPQLKVYELGQLSMKFKRHLDSEIVDFQLLEDDYGKMAILCADRSVQFHAKYGKHYATRFPRQGRDLTYLPFLADLVVVGSAPEVYRLSLSEGRFLTPLPSRSPAINACGWSGAHGLLACAGEDGALECFDPRAPRAVGCLDAAAASGASGAQLTALRFDASGMRVATGTSTGLVSVFDLRSSKPVVTRDHMYGEPIIDIKWHEHGADDERGAVGSGRRIVSTDARICKIWDASDGSPFTSIQPADKSGDVQDCCVFARSGLVMLACDSSLVQSFFVPSLGPAPPWCSFLEALTEELEETAAPTLYDDYRFVTRAEVKRLGLAHLVGTSLLRAYLHGFFVDNRLYHKATNLANPFAYEEYRKKRVQEKLDAERKSRISVVRKLPKVNAKVAARAMAAQGKQRAEGDAAEGAAPNVLEDDRFAAMFQDPDFAVDEESKEYQLLHPGKKGSARAEAEDALLEEHFQELSSEEDAPEDERRWAKERKSGVPRMLVAKEDANVDAFRAGRSLAAEREVALEDRLAQEGRDVQRRVARGGAQEMTFTIGGKGEGADGAGGAAAKRAGGKKKSRRGR
ncbi:unnamed protein product [Pedinophyceae sp. YPF-701]|nr:unnamed protein product [Pedinophyceae sp. YPF-701]